MSQAQSRLRGRRAEAPKGESWTATSHPRDLKICHGDGCSGTIVPREIEELHEAGVERIFSPDDGRDLGLQGMINQVVKGCDFKLDEIEVSATAELVRHSTASFSPSGFRRRLPWGALRMRSRDGRLSFGESPRRFLITIAGPAGRIDFEYHLRTMSKVGILGLGAYVPERVMTNDDWARHVDHSATDCDAAMRVPYHHSAGFVVQGESL